MTRPRRKADALPLGERLLLGATYALAPLFWAAFIAWIAK